MRPTELQDRILCATGRATPLRPQQTSSIASKDTAKSTHAPKRLTGIHILAAEDNAVNRALLEHMLTYEGATVEFGFNGHLALELVQIRGASAFDIVLCDIQMPVMDGFEMTRILTRLAPRLPIVGLTANTCATATEMARQVGMVDYVTKPYMLDTLVEVILKHAAPRQTPTPTQ